jgi:hypothetical protein
MSLLKKNAHQAAAQATDPIVDRATFPIVDQSATTEADLLEYLINYMMYIGVDLKFIQKCLERIVEELETTTHAHSMAKTEHEIAKLHLSAAEYRLDNGTMSAKKEYAKRDLDEAKCERKVKEADATIKLFKLRKTILEFYLLKEKKIIELIQYHVKLSRYLQDMIEYENKIQTSFIVILLDASAILEFLKNEYENSDMEFNIRLKQLNSFKNVQEINSLKHDKEIKRIAYIKEKHYLAECKEINDRSIDEITKINKDYVSCLDKLKQFKIELDNVNMNAECVLTYDIKRLEEELHKVRNF